MTDPNPLHAIGPAFLAAIQPLFLLVVGISILRIVAALLARGWRLRNGPAVVARPLLTEAELRFLHVLADALPDLSISCQVAMGALLRPEKGLDKRTWWSTYGRFSQMIVDFVAVDPVDGSVVALVELDDRSHSVAKDDARDARLHRAGYTVIRFGNRPWPTVTRVRERFDGLVAVTPVQPSRRRTRA